MFDKPVRIGYATSNKSGRLAWDVTGENDDQTYIWGNPYFLTTHIFCDNFGWHSTLGTSSPAPTCMDLMAPVIRWNLYGFGVIRNGEILQFDSIPMINHGFLGLQYPMRGQNSNWSLRIVEYQSENPVPFPSSFSAENSPARPLTRSWIFPFAEYQTWSTTEVENFPWFRNVSDIDLWRQDDLSYQYCRHFHALHDRWIGIVIVHQRQI